MESGDWDAPAGRSTWGTLGDVVLLFAESERNRPERPFRGCAWLRAPVLTRLFCVDPENGSRGKALGVLLSSSLLHQGSMSLEMLLDLEERERETSMEFSLLRRMALVQVVLSTYNIV